MFDYSLSLMTGTDIPIPEFEIVIHQPTIKEISLIGEKMFFTGIQLLALNKELYIEDEDMLSQVSNFQLFIEIMNQTELAERREAVLQVLTLILPQEKVIFTPRSMMFNSSDKNIIIDEGNFETFQHLIKTIFCLSKSDNDSFNPQGKKAKEIAKKLLKGRQIAAQQNAQQNGGSMFGRYLSVLTVGIGSMRLQDCCELTMYQLYDLLERYMLYVNWDMEIRARMAGAKGDKPIEDWMKNIH